VHKFWSVHGFDDTHLKPLDDALAAWNKDYPAHIAAQAKAQAAAARKNTRIGVAGGPPSLEPEARQIAAFIQTFLAATDADRATIGIRAHPHEGSPPSLVPTTRPLARIESGNRLTHALRFSDESTPTRRGKPEGAEGAEVWLALAEPNSLAPPPPDTSASGRDAYKFISLSSRGNLSATFASQDAGKTAFCALHWVSTRGQKVPWSEPAAATVAA